MKLICCSQCFDVVSLRKEPRVCSCGQSSGHYLDELNAEYAGAAVPLGFDNHSFIDALRNQPDSGWGRTFDAFVIPKECDTFIKKPQ